MFGIPAVLIVIGIAAFAVRRQHRHGAVLIWGIVLGCFLGAGLHAAVTAAMTGGLNGLGTGLTAAFHGAAGAVR